MVEYKNYFKFNLEADTTEEWVKHTRDYIILKKLETGTELFERELDFLASIKSKGYSRLMGWQFNFFPFLSKFVLCSTEYFSAYDGLRMEYWKDRAALEQYYFDDDNYEEYPIFAVEVKDIDYY